MVKRGISPMKAKGIIAIATCRLTQRAPDLKRARQTLTVNLIPLFQAGNANRYAAPR